MRVLLASALLLAATAFATSSIEEELSHRLDLNKLKALKERINDGIWEKLQKSPEDRKELDELLAEIGDYKLPEDELEGDENQINLQAGISNDLFEGDMMLTDAQLDEFEFFDPRNMTRARRQAQKGPRFPTNHWGKNPVIPFSFDRSYPNTALNMLAIRGAIKYWEANTCIRFREGAAGADRVKFIFGQGCYSYVGRTGGEQVVSIGNGCGSVGTVAHELAHTFGIFHVQSRNDRDSYVYVNERNINRNMMNNFDQETTSSTDNYGLPYEFGSNMHYGEGESVGSPSYPYIFPHSPNNPRHLASASTMPSLLWLPVVATRSTSTRRLPTFYDISLVNKYYNCYDNCRNQISCQNGGVQDVNNCNQCKCPSGWAGQLCNQRPAGTKTITVSSTPQQFVMQAGQNSRSELLDFSNSYVLLQAPAGRKIRLQMNKMDGISGGDCHWGGAEVQFLRDARLAGIKFCDINRREQDVVSEDNSMFITVFNRQYSNVYTFTASLA